MQAIARWHQTNLGLVVFALAELAIAYGFASLAIDRGSLWYYILALIFVVGFLQNVIKLIWVLAHGHKTTKA